MPEYTIDTLNELYGDLEFNSFNELRNKYYDELRQTNLSTLKLLEIYSFGTIEDYLRFKDEVIDLNEDQLLKLRQLTLMSLARSSNTISLDSIKEKLRIDEDAELFNVLMKLSTTKNQLISYYIDSQNKELSIRTLKSRDVFKGRREHPLLLLNESQIDESFKLDYLITRLQQFQDVKITKAIRKVENLQRS